MKNVAPERKCMQITNTNTNVSILYLFLCFPIFSLQDENFAKFKQSKLKRTNTINNPFSCNFCCAKTDIWCCAVLLCNPPPLSPPRRDYVPNWSNQGLSHVSEMTCFILVQSFFQS